MKHIINVSLDKGCDPIHEGIVLAQDAIEQFGSARSALIDFEYGTDPWTFPNEETLEACHSELIALRRVERDRN